MWYLLWKFELLLNDEKYNEIKKGKLNDEFDRILNDNDGEQINDIGKTNKINANIEATPKQINKFAQYVKDNYNSIKKDKNLTKHKDVMQELSKNFKTLSTKWEYISRQILSIKFINNFQKTIKIIYGKL